MPMRGNFKRWAGCESVRKIRDWLDRKADGKQFVSEGTLKGYLAGVWNFADPKVVPELNLTASMMPFEEASI